MSVPASRLRAQRAAPQRGHAQPAPARLEVVRERARRSRRQRITPVISAVLVSGSLLAVVVGHALVAQEQVRLATVDAALTAAQLAHRHDVVSVAKLEDPARILREAETKLRMVTPGQVVQLPHVRLTTPLPSPALTPAAPSSAGNPAPGSP